MNQRIKLDLNNEEVIYSKLLDMKDNTAKTKEMFQDVSTQCIEVFVQGYVQYDCSPTFAHMERKYNDLDVVVGVTLFYVLQAFKKMIRQDRILAARVLNGMLEDKNVKEEDKKYIIENQDKMLNQTEKTLRSRREAAERGEVPPPEQNETPVYNFQPTPAETKTKNSGETQKEGTINQTKQIDGQFKLVREGLFYNEVTHQYGILQEDGSCIIVNESDMSQAMTNEQNTFDMNEIEGNSEFQKVSEGVYYHEESGHYAVQQENGEYTLVSEDEIVQEDTSVQNSEKILGTPIAGKYIDQTAWEYQKALHPDVRTAVESLPSEFVEKSHTILSKIGTQESTIHNTTFPSVVKSATLGQPMSLKINGTSLFQPETGDMLKSKTLISAMKVEIPDSNSSNKDSERKGF